jgi:hypothetical protein
MKRFALSAVLLFVVLPVVVPAPSAYADSIPTFYITQATMFMGPNDGSGDNLSFSLTGPGINITGIGGMGCSFWCSGNPIPDPSIAFPSQISLTGFGPATIGGKIYDGMFLSFSPSIFDEGGGLIATTSGLAGSDTGPLQFNLTLPTNGIWNFNFAPTTDENGNPAFIFTDGEFTASATLPTPEPASLLLLGTGLVGIGWLKHRAKKSFLSNRA